MIGYGLSTSIPTYNFKEACMAAIDLIRDPDIDVVLVPDSPTGAHIVDEGRFPEISRTGKGQFKMRGVITIDESDNSLIVTSTPLMVNWNGKNAVKENIIRVLNDGKNNMLKGIDDLSEDTGMKFKLYLKKEADPVAIMHTIFSKTNMEKTFGVNFKLTENYTDQDYTIKTLLQTWIDFRRETKRRYYAHKLTAGKERQHILSILLMILSKDNAEKTVTIFKKSENTAKCAEALMKTYGITSLQAKTIADMKFSALTKEAYKRYVKEKEEIDAEVVDVEKIIRSPKKIDKIIIKELEEGIKLFGEDRRSEIITIDNEVKVRDTDHLIVFTKNGMVKKLPKDIKHIGNIATNDFPKDFIEINNMEDLILFDASGRVNRLPVSKIPNSTLNSDGFRLIDYCNVSGEVVTVKPAPSEKELSKLKTPVYYLMVTRNGYIKKTSVEAFMNMKNDLLGIIVKEKDALICCKVLAGDRDVVVYTNTGRGVRFNTSEITETGRMSIGTMCIDSDGDETIIGMDILNPKDKYLLVITNKGYCKKCTLDTYGSMSRKSKPLRIVTLDTDDSINIIRTIRGDEIIKVFMTNETVGIDVSADIPELPRVSKGRKILPVKRGNAIMNIR